MRPADPRDTRAVGECRHGLLLHRHGLGSELRRETGLVAGLHDAGLSQERADGVGRLRAAIEPEVRAILVELQCLLTRPRRVLAEDLEELAVARRTAIGDDDAVGRGLLAAVATETDTNGHAVIPRETGCGYCARLIAMSGVSGTHRDTSPALDGHPLHHLLHLAELLEEAI